MTEPNRDVPTQVRQVRRALVEKYECALDNSDLESESGPAREQRALSRALSALALRILHDCDISIAAAHVIDGANDHGIDAIGLVKSRPHVYLVQAKWSDEGRAKLDHASALKLVNGLDRIDRELYQQFNPRGEILAQRAKELMNEGAPITLVGALMGTTPPGEGAMEVFGNARRQYNAHGDRLDTRFLFAADFHHRIRDDLEPPPVRLTINMEKWLQHDGLRPAFQGNVRVEEVAEWYKQHQSRLFDLNICSGLGITQTNSEITTTLTDEPAHFWYFNNGITILCDRVHAYPRSAGAPQTSSVRLEAEKASVVNGAQTVNAIHEAMVKNPAMAANAQVSVRVIETGGLEAFAQKTTQATNQQNQVQARDFAALDPIQGRIRTDLAAELSKEYTIKRGSIDPAPEAGCSIMEAATALACIHSNPEYVAQATRKSDSLWEQGEQGTYRVLFHPQPSPYQIWRSVLTVRKVREELHTIKLPLEGRALALAQHGELLIAHLVLQCLATSEIDDYEYPWESTMLSKIPDLTKQVFLWLFHHLHALYAPSAPIRPKLESPDHCKALAEAVLNDVRARSPLPMLPAGLALEPQPRQRRPKTVSLLINVGALTEGTPLIFSPANARESQALSTWLGEDPRRSRATWVNNRSKPILWAADQKQHSPSGLVELMWRRAKWENRPVANQGPARWKVPSGETLAEMAERIQSLEESGEAEYSGA